MKKYFILAAAAIMISACSFDHELDYDGSGTITTSEGPMQLTLGYSFGNLKDPSVATRGNNTGLQSDTINKDAKIGLFVLKEGAKSTTETYERINLASTSLTKDKPITGYTLANVTSVTTADDVLLYPEDKSQKIDIYAYAPYINNSVSTNPAISNIPATFGDKDATSKLYKGDITTDKITFFTETDQTQNEDYWKSDVLWGCAGTGSYVSAAAATSPEGPYEKLKGTASTNSANKNEISANEYITIKAKTTSGIDGAYYLNVDGTDPKKNTADVIVPMLHRGSKIIVKLHTNGMELEKLQNADVIFNVDYLQGELNISDGSYTGKGTPTATDVYLTRRLAMTEWVEKTEDTSVSPSTWNLPTITEDASGVEAASGTEPKKYVCSAVVVPQDLSTADRSLIKIVLYNDGQQKDSSQGYYDTGSTVKKYSEQTATYVYTGKVNLEAGKKYIYDITVTASGLTVTTTVQNWTEGQTNPETGTAELE